MQPRLTEHFGYPNMALSHIPIPVGINRPRLSEQFCLVTTSSDNRGCTVRPVLGLHNMLSKNSDCKYSVSMRLLLHRRSILFLKYMLFAEAKNK